MGRILCIDYGEKRVGIAITDELKIISSPLDVLKNDSTLLEKLKIIIEKYNPEKIIIGLPVHSSNISEKRVKNFGEMLKSLLNINIEYYDESYSTVYAELLLKSLGTKRKKIKKVVDKYAASKILQDYLEKLRQENV